MMWAHIQFYSSFWHFNFFTVWIQIIFQWKHQFKTKIMNYLAPFEFYVLINVEKLPLSIFPHSPKLSQITVSSTLINFHSTFSNSRNFPKTEEARALLLCDKTETTVFLADRLRSEDPEFALCPCRFKRCD